MRRRYFFLLIALGLSMAGGVQAADTIQPPPKPNTGLTIEVAPGDAPQCRTQDKAIKDSASRTAEKVRDYRDCFKNHIGSGKPRR